MAETIISQLDRAFANPLETNRQVNFISDRDAISALKRWEGMQVYVKSELTTYELRGGILNEHWTDTAGVDAANYTPTGGYAGTAQDIVDSIEISTGGNEIISITHIENLDYYVIADPYKINSEYYSAAPTTVTLTVGDATNARIDVIYADINGLIGVLAGTPSATPVKPIVSNSQRELTFRTVPALATVDPLVTNEVVFNENLGVVGGEMDVDGWNLTALNFNSTAVAFSGTKSIYFDGVDPYFNVDFKNDVNIAVSGLSSFYFRVYVTEVLDRNASFFFHCLDTSFIATGTSRTVKDGLFGFDRNVLNTWQLISIPIAFFNLPVSEIKGIRFMVSSIKKPKMYIDTMAFQYNVTQPDLTPTIYELTSNKKTDIEANKTSNIFYASVKAIYDWAVGLFISGSGTQNYLPKFGVGGKVVGNSQIFDNGTNVGLSTNNPLDKIHIIGNVRAEVASGGGFKVFSGSTLIGDFVRDTIGTAVSPVIRGVLGRTVTIQNTDSSSNIFQWATSLGVILGLFNNNGNLALGALIPTEKLHVAGNGKFTGSVQVGDNTAVASATNVGAIRYRVSGNNSYAEICMQNGASSYIWETLTVHSW